MPAAKRYDLAVEFGNLSVAKEMASIAVKVSRDNKLPIDEADALFVNTQCDCKLCCDVNGEDDAEDQETFIDTSLAIPMLATLRGFSVKGGYFRTSLHVPKDVLSETETGKLAGRTGKLQIRKVTAVPDKAGSDE